MDDEQWQTEQFERHRARLRAVAYRMLGSVSEADDAVQETWLRLHHAHGGIDNIGGWLTTVVGRVCVDMLRARYARREDYVDTWLPDSEITVETDDDPEQQSLLADSVGLALLGPVSQYLLGSRRPASPLAALSSSPIQPRYRLLLRLAIGAPDAAP